MKKIFLTLALIFSLSACAVTHTPVMHTIELKDMDYSNIDNLKEGERCLPIRKHRGAREKRYSFGYAVFLILALMK